VRLNNLKAGGPWNLEVVAGNRIVIPNVLVGEVWLCSGQSNMAALVRESGDAQRETASSSNPLIRLYRVPRIEAESPVEDSRLLKVGEFRFVRRVQRESPEGQLNARWEECEPESVSQFSAVCYFFGRDLQRARGVPVGLIDASVGATPIEAWMSRESLVASADLKELLDGYHDAMAEFQQQSHMAPTATGDANQPQEQAKQPWRPSGLYNGMIAPLRRYAIKGVLWWQGEANVSRARSYGDNFVSLIRGWRREWEEGEFPFLFVQLATAGPPGQAPEAGDVWGRPALAWAELREVQRLTLSRVPRTAMAVITDLGGENYHPYWKQPVGARLSLAARRIAYGESVVYSGPLYASHKIAAERIVLTFSHVGRGLTTTGGELLGFDIAGADRIFHPAHAEIRSDGVVLTSSLVSKPIAARYGWAAHPVGNLFNQEGLPASPFRTDDW
jgi:sialate O-acetylesterase